MSTPQNFMYEKKHHPLASRRTLLLRILKTSILAFSILIIWLMVGIMGYRITCNFGWYDSLLNAAMIMSGMGPTKDIAYNWGKVFASVYAIISGILFITCVGIFLTPIVHRFLHKFHLETK